MGIPAYFSYIIKNYPNILQKFNEHFNVDCLYLDSNSIIYDSLKTIKYCGNTELFERELIDVVCKNIEIYIEQISPSHLVYIAFDGVAPVAKLKQQKQRRYKSWFMSMYEQNNMSSWDSSSITPGTEFMNKLNLQVQYHFRNAIVHNVNKIIVSGSNIPGEGEHKIFEYIRENQDTIKNMKTVIYGLDADLIMLTINHLDRCPNMYLFRETPDFIRSIDKSLDPNSLYIIDILSFKQQLTYYLNNDVYPNTDEERNRVDDYIFMCFMLGNDFLPHFPSIDIRSGGMDILLNIYRKLFGSGKQNIIVNGKIVWRNFRKLISALAENEEIYIQDNFKHRSMMEKRPIMIEDNCSKFDKEMLHAPIINREIEKYINPFDMYWDIRYYDMLFDIDITDDLRKQISLNYLEGLEWTFKYYNSGCVDWRWGYKYHYPPLLKDLLKYIPYFDTELLDTKEKNPVRDLVQLAYVLPRKCLNLLPRKIETKLLVGNANMFREDYEFIWAYCRYFWECHVKFPYIDIKLIEDIVNNSD